MTDRDIMVAILLAVSALAEKLTGERLTVGVPTETGECVFICSQSGVWAQIPPAAVPAPFDHHEQVPSTLQRATV